MPISNSMSIQNKYIWSNKQMQTQTKVVALHYTLNILPIMLLATPSITTYTQKYTTRLFSVHNSCIMVTRVLLI